MNNYSDDETVNAGTGKELTIKELTELVAKVIGYDGKILWDTTKPNGTPRKLLDVSKAENLYLLFILRYLILQYSRKIYSSYSFGIGNSWNFN